jgi:hypothetical protein
MGNPYKGEASVEIGGKRLPLRFTWDVIARIKNELGADALGLVLGGDSPEVMAKLLALALQEAKPGITTADVMRASPPYVPTIQAIKKASDLFYWGPDGAPDDLPENPLHRMATKLLRLLKLR